VLGFEREARVVTDALEPREEPTRARGGASSAADAKSTRAATDPCSLLTPRDIQQVAGWTTPAGTHPVENSADGHTACNFTEPKFAGMVQIQVYDHGGRAAFDRRRSEAEHLALGAGNVVTVPGTVAAFEIPEHGLVGLLVGDAFAQVVTLGPGVTDRQQHEMAVIVAGNLA
jgi:hypothetical protein